MELQGARVAVVGLAKSGLSAVALLRAQGALVTASDEKPLDSLPEAARAALKGVAFVQQVDDPTLGQDLVVLSPGVPDDLAIVKAARGRGVKVIGELELASYFLVGPVIGVTGSNGKTTTTALIGHILRESGIDALVGGNIGTPPTAMVGMSNEDTWLVLELSSFQLETAEHFTAKIGVCLNVTPDHLDRHKTMEAYKAAKGRLFATQRAGSFAVLNAEDEACTEYAGLTPGWPVWFSQEREVTPGLHVREGVIVLDDDAVMAVSEIPLRGRHNVENVLAAAAAAHLAGATLEQIAAAVKTFPGVEHRIEFVCERAGVAWYNDSKATNVDAALKAVEAFEQRLWIILGGKDKGSDYRPLAAALQGHVAGALLIGAAAEKIAGQLGGLGQTGGAVPLVACGTIEAAVDHAARHAVAGDVVLLAPACASFDQFTSYEHRGRVFKELVRSLNDSDGGTN
ncbi:MAG: UDP-N-acetylmuramoyl-L-alanine--D-glutamate ligase [Acidobacteria bacterium]|nr:UDP-N-acetylmuramoyl-L-alanine--D-glutamate ligase [Acidobacteriota bacterium]